MTSKPLHKPIAQFDEGERVFNLISNDVVFLIEGLVQEVINTTDQDTVMSHWLIRDIEMTGIHYDSGGHCVEFISPKYKEHVFKMCLRPSVLPERDFDTYGLVKTNINNPSSSTSYSFVCDAPDVLVCLRHLIRRHYKKYIKRKALPM